MTRSRKALLVAGAAGTTGAAYLAGLVSIPLGSNAEVAPLLVLMLALCAWPLLLRSVPFGARAAMSGVAVAALALGLQHGGCGRDGSSSGGELCLGHCAESLQRLRVFERDCWPLAIGGLGRFALAVTCANAEPLRVQRGAGCSSTHTSR